MSMRFEIASSSALPNLKTSHVGSVRIRVHLPATHPNWQQAAVNAPEWTVLMQILKDVQNEMDCVMVQQMLQARTNKNKGETVKTCRKGG